MAFWKKELPIIPIRILGEYHRPYLWDGRRNPHYQGLSLTINRVGANDLNAIENMANMMINAITKAGLTDQTDMICSVPANIAGVEVTGIRQVAAAVASRLECIDGTDFLIRVRNKPKADRGGRKSRWHRSTLIVSQQRKVLNKRILLLDDVTRTGQTLRVTGDVLVNAGAKSVMPVALGQIIGNDARFIALGGHMAQSLRNV